MAISSQIHEPEKYQEFSNGRRVIPFNSVKSLAKEKLHLLGLFTSLHPLKIYNASASSALRGRSYTIFLLLIVGSRRTSCGVP
jgi:hypothetical protein